MPAVTGCFRKSSMLIKPDGRPLRAAPICKPTIPGITASSTVGLAVFMFRAVVVGRAVR